MPTSDPTDLLRLAHGAEVTSAARALEARRLSLAALYAAVEGDDGGEVVVVGGGPEFTAWLFGQSDSWRHLHSIRLAGPDEGPDLLAQSLRNNRRLVDNGLEMASVFGETGFAPDVVDLLAAQAVPYRLTPLPSLPIKVVDKHVLLLEGPEVDGRRSLMAVRDGVSLSLARRYWRAVLHSSRTAVETAEGRAPLLAGTTSRQRAVLALIAREASDEQAAALLDISVRTLRSEVAAIKRLLGVTTRFAAGIELGRRMAAAAPQSDS